MASGDGDIRTEGRALLFQVEQLLLRYNVLYRPCLAKCQAVLEDVLDMEDDAKVFMDPVPKSYQPYPDKPAYHKVVKRPITLSDIQDKVLHAKYADPDGFIADVRLIFSNCYLFHGHGSPYSAQARRLETVFEKRAVDVLGAPKPDVELVARGAGALARMDAEVKQAVRELVQAYEGEAAVRDGKFRFTPTESSYATQRALIDVFVKYKVVVPNAKRERSTERAAASAAPRGQPEAAARAAAPAPTKVPSPVPAEAPRPIPMKMPALVPGSGPLGPPRPIPAPVAAVPSAQMEPHATTEDDTDLFNEVMNTAADGPRNPPSVTIPKLADAPPALEQNKHAFSNFVSDLSPMHVYESALEDADDEDLFNDDLAVARAVDA